MRRCTSDNNLGGTLIADIIISCAATYFAATILRQVNHRLLHQMNQRLSLPARPTSQRGARKWFPSWRLEWSVGSPVGPLPQPVQVFGRIGTTEFI